MAIAIILQHHEKAQFCLNRGTEREMPEHTEVNYTVI